LIRRALIALGAAFVCAPVLTVSCGSKSGLYLGATDAGPDAAKDAPADVFTPDCVFDEDCMTGDPCERSVCQEGKCSVPVPLQCNDDDPCTEDSCLPETGQCDFRELALDQDGDGFKGPRPGFAAGAPGSCGDDCDDTSKKAYPGGTEVCDGVDNNCNGVIDEGCGLQTGILQFTIAWSEPRADVDLNVTGPDGELARFDEPTQSGLLKDRDCPGSEDACRGQNVENVFLAEGAPRRGRYRVVVRLEDAGDAVGPVRVRLSARIGQRHFSTVIELSTRSEQRELEFTL